MKNNIYYSLPSIRQSEIDIVKDAMENGWGNNCYGYINKFESKFSEYLDIKHAICTSSCTGALHMGLAALAIGQDDEVILADTNWIATVSPVVHLGAKPIFVDIDPLTWCIDPNQVRLAISPNTKAIIATHLYGNVCDLEELLKISEEYNIPLIEDAAESLGSSFNSRKTGVFGCFGVFSFHGSKTITTGEGGMFVTNDDDLYEKVLTLSNHGRAVGQEKQFWPDMIGFKYKMSNIEAALGYAQMLRIEEITMRKREILSLYKAELSNYDCIMLNDERAGVINGAWMPTAVFTEPSKITRDILLKAFLDKRIDARVFFWPLSSLPMFQTNNNNKNAYSIASRAINLPSYVDMTNEQINEVIDVIKSLLKSVKI